MFRHGFYNSVNGDRRYSAEDMNRFLAGLFTEGVYPGFMQELKVFPYGTSNGGPQVYVGTGKAYLFETWMYNDNQYMIDLPVNTSASARIDKILIEVNKPNRENTIKVSNTALVNTSTVKQYLLAEVSVPPNVTNASGVTITDKRGNGAAGSSTPFASPIMSNPSINLVPGPASGLYNLG